MAENKKSNQEVDLESSSERSELENEEISENKKDNDLEKEVADYKDKLLRMAAEYENFRKRSEKEKETIYSDAISFTVMSILPIADSLEAALTSSENQNEEYRKGIKLLKDQFEKALKTLKVESFGEVGEKFDPSIHNAISHIEEESDKENEISKVFQKGYKSSTRIIRHAMVQVTN